MTKTRILFEEIQKARLVALLSPARPGECVSAYRVCRAEGIVLEVALRSENALDGIRAVLEEHSEARVLAGTVVTAAQAEEAIRAGAAGVVSPDYIPEVVAVCVDNDIMCIPGGLADAGKQLVQKAMGYGVSLEDLRKKHPHQWVYKLFPAFSGGVSHMGLAKAWKGPYPGLKVLYTGGITEETLPEAVHQDPEGIFCASALGRDAAEPEKMASMIRTWKAVLSPSRRPAAAVRKTAVRVPDAGKASTPPRVVTFGELMLRLSPGPGVRLNSARTFHGHFGGAEANVAVCLARFGLRSSFVGALPENPLGDNACRTLRALGVDTRFLLRRPGRMGLYFLEHGAGPRASRVLYDRAPSAFSELEASELDWQKILDGASWFHWTGITPALSPSVRGVLHRGLEAARSLGLTVSADLNYRRKLWSQDEAREVMTSLMPYVDVLIGNEEDPFLVFGITPEKTEASIGKLDISEYRKLARELVKEYGFKKVAITLRESLSAEENFWSGCLSDGRTFLQGPRHHVRVLDRVGTGDAFAAGLIYSLLQNRPDEEALAFAVAAACLKHTIWGDFNDVSVAEVERLASGEGSGRIRR
ncbi:MAG: KHG/KDPG aldolase/sugar kinase fusion protein [Candidatus Aminicenantales bacterium]